MKKLILLIILIGFCLSGFSQTTIKKVKGRYFPTNLLTTFSYDTVIGYRAINMDGTGMSGFIAITANDSTFYLTNDDGLGRIWNSGGNVEIEDTTILDKLKAEGDSIMLLDDIATDRWLHNSGNTFFGEDVAGGGGLTHVSGDQGYLNTFFGFQTGFDVTSAHSNCLFGNLAGENLTNGTQNVLIGSTSANGMTTADGNVIIGDEAGYYNYLEGNYNTLIGFEAGKGTGLSTNSYNVIMGMRAGSSISTGNNNVFIGAYASNNVTTGSNNITLGYNIDVTSATGSNQMNIGGVIFSDDLTASEIGIDTTAPEEALHVNGDIICEDTLFIEGDKLAFWERVNDSLRLTINSDLLGIWRGGTHEQLILSPSGITGIASLPTLAFGDGNTGFYESSDNVLDVSVSTNAVARFSSNGLVNPSNTGWALPDETPTATNPVINPRMSDPDVGIGWAGGDQLSLIAGGVEGIRITEATQMLTEIEDTARVIGNGFLEAATLSFSGDATTMTSAQYSKSVFLPIEWGNEAGYTGIPDASEEITSGVASLFVRKFDHAADDTILFVWEADTSLDATKNIRFEVVGLITESTAPASGEGVSFFCAGFSIGDDDALDGTFGTAVESNYVDLDNLVQYDKFLTTKSSDMVVTDLAAGETVIFRLYRDVSDADDDYAQKVGDCGIRIYYVKNLD